MNKKLLTTEKNTVERAIEIEDQMEKLMSERERLEDELSQYSMHPVNSNWMIERLNDIERELSDLQREYRG